MRGTLTPDTSYWAHAWFLRRDRAAVPVVMVEFEGPNPEGIGSCNTFSPNEACSAWKGRYAVTKCIPASVCFSMFLLLFSKDYLQTSRHV